MTGSRLRNTFPFSCNSFLKRCQSVLHYSREEVFKFLKISLNRELQHRVKDEQMNPQQHMQTLRVRLLAMARLSQRALDDSIKGYATRNLDFSRHVRAADGEIEGHHRRIKELCRELTNGGIHQPVNSRFTLAAAGINTALHVTYTAAAQIAQDSVRLLEGSGIHGCAALERMGQHVNGSMRLCVVSLFEKNAGHAKAALRRQESLPLRELTCVSSHPHIDRWSGAQGDFERSVIRSLTEVAKQAHEMADTILFWLEEQPCVATSVSAKHLPREFPSTRAQAESGAFTYLQSKTPLVPKITQSFSC
jgi:phosphate transport system protein